MGEMTIVKARRGFAVSGGQPYYLHEGTKRACKEYIARCEATRAELAAFEAEKATRTAAKLEALGIGEIDFRRLRDGDLYATSPDGPVRVVTAVRHMDSGASVAYHETSPVDRACGDQGCLILTPAFPVYGLLRHDGED